MKILALDIGAGTTDVLLHDDGVNNIENCIKMVLPSPSRVFAKQVREATRSGQDIFIEGDIIGGGAFAFALRDHLEKELRVMITESAAYTVRNDLNEVRDLGIETISAKDKPTEFRGESLIITEVNLVGLQEFLTGFDEPLSNVDAVAIAVQDHGVSPQGLSNRRFRIRKIKELLEEDPRPESLAFTEKEIPSCFLRMKSAARASRRQLPRARVLLMDTSPAAILGCLNDPAVKEADPVLAVNVGNGHTTATIISEREVAAMVEHHTRLLDPQRMEHLLTAFGNGKLRDEEVFTNNGHGLFYLQEPPTLSGIEKIAATGPNRNILASTNLPVHFAAPAGDVMMTGPIGLVEATKRKLRQGCR